MRYSTLTLLIHIAFSISFVFGTETTMSNRRELVKFKFDTLPPGAVRPTGWLKDQLQLSADGLAGHLFEFYRYVARSTWLGGDWEYSELNEASPYWFNYIVPLAWSLDDARLKSQAKAYLDYVLDHQAEDGWLGPESTRQTRGLWARSLLLFGLTQYAEADPSARDRIVDSMHKFLKLTKSHDYVLEPTELWQYAIDPDSIVVKTSTSAVKNPPNPIFTKDAPPVFLTVDAWKIAWPTDQDTAAWPPIDPVVDKDKKESIKLVPFGSAKLHIAQFPVAKPQ
ncbi:hypothetical protein H9Q70_004841 [Fusarium xylarioides]|nr:hypothetical protein H9Q70_004841 [Fusarium xylarioides]